MPINQWSDDILIAELSDEPNLSDDLAALTRHLGSKTGDDLPDVVLDMRGVTFLNSSNIAQLLRVRQMLVNGGRNLRMCCIHDQVWSVLIITGLDKLFDVADDVATSLASLQISE